MMLERAVAVPRQAIPVPMPEDVMNSPMAATLPANKPRFKAWRAGKSVGAESSRPTTKTASLVSGKIVCTFYCHGLFITFVA